MSYSVAGGRFQGQDIAFSTSCYVLLEGKNPLLVLVSSVFYVLRYIFMPLCGFMVAQILRLYMHLQVLQLLALFELF